MMNSSELLSRVRDELAIPGSAPGRYSGASPSASVAATEEWRQLHRAIAELEANVLEVGEIPRGYPRHVDWVMRVLHAMLPWYTRPLRRHAEHTAAVCRAMRDVLAGVIAAQQQGAGAGASAQNEEGGKEAAKGSTPKSPEAGSSGAHGA